MAKTKSQDAQLPHLETFIRAAELCNFTETAKSLRLTQAAVSQRIQLLEKTLGKSLFQRSGGRVMLTAAGQKLYDYARRIMDLHREARREIAGQELPPLAGELLLAASSVPGEHLLPGLLSNFGKHYPHIRIRATISDSMEVMEQVEQGKVSLGLVGRKSDNPHLEFRFLVSDKMALVVPANHPLSSRTQVTVKQMTGQPLILREAGSGLRHNFEKALQQAGLSLADFHIALELGSNEAIKEAVLRSVGVAILSLQAVQKEVKAGQLHALRVKDLSLDRDMFIVWDQRRVLPPPAQLFLTFLETHPLPTSAP